VLEALNFAEEMKLDQQQPYWKDPAVFSRLSRILEFVETGPYSTPEVAAFSANTISTSLWTTGLRRLTRRR
jgi:hypothetical protein